MNADYEELLRRLGEISDLGRARALLAWDERTHMPPGGGEARAEQLATLTRVRHERLSSDELGSLLDRLRPEAEKLPYDSDEASMVRTATREWDKARRVPGELRAEIARAASLAERAWVDARGGSDFALFLPSLERNVELKRRYLECFDDADHPYDPLLDDFEPQTTTAEVRPVLDALREGLRPLVAEIAERADSVDSSCLHGAFPIDAQRRLVHGLVADLPLDAGAWRLDTTVHPFATAIATTDIRLTTRYDETYLGAALWGALHEAGHGIYESGFDPALRRSPLCRPPSLGLHESQSRTWENWVGRSRPYLRHIHPRLRDEFPQPFATVDAEELYRAANRVAPSLIRIEADELTYNLHIALRFELELEIFEDRLVLADLPEAWNARMKHYLGIEVPDDARGVLQDVHWAAGSFGYFPTYSLGNVIAGQIWALATEALPDLDRQIERGELEPLRDWLRERLYRHGGKFTPAETLERVCGAPLSVEPYLAQMRRKMGGIYGLAG
ncbi:MAG TPA: carboxypeptidase M32 [Solirubrobacterales bacterium]|nr:carboxypeptidase M32 [Solirubrobacterales bacterium]